MQDKNRKATQQKNTCFTVMGDELEPVHVCIIHFEGKEGVLTKLAQGSLTKIIERRKQGLNLSSSSYTVYSLYKNS